MTTVRSDMIFYICSEVDGKWYATITVIGEDAEPVVAIAGPFADVEEAKAYNDRRRELADRRGELRLTDMASVPPKARQGITDDVLRGWRQGDFGLQGNDDYSPINFEPKKRTWH